MPKTPQPQHSAFVVNGALNPRKQSANRNPSLTHNPLALTWTETSGSAYRQGLNCTAPIPRKVAAKTSNRLVRLYIPICGDILRWGAPSISVSTGSGIGGVLLCLPSALAFRFQLLFDFGLVLSGCSGLGVRRSFSFYSGFGLSGDFSLHLDRRDQPLIRL
jgi:hypothetical protein